MLEHYQLFNKLYQTKYTKSGLDVDWAIDVDSETVYLLFRGSSTPTDWFVNFNFPVKPYKHQKNPMFVHRGFSKSYKSCNDEIMEAFIKAVNENPDKEVVIVGHSYGGAMSMFAAEDFNFRTGKKAKMVTFGSPDIIAPIAPKTKKHFDEAIGEKYIYARKTDIVPHLPPFYSSLKKIKLGKFSIKGIFQRHPNAHCSYGDKTLYK